MSSPYITYKNSTVSSLVSQTLTNWYLLQRIVAEMNSLVGSPANYAALETPFGLAAGTGQAFYNTVVGFKASMDTACPVLANLDTIA